MTKLCNHKLGVGLNIRFLGVKSGLKILVRVREAITYQLCIFFNTVQKGGGQTHVQNFFCKYSIILKGFLATKFDMNAF